MSKRGRPTLKSKTLENIAIKLASEGKINSQIAKTIGVGLSTLENWISKDEFFSKALKEAKLSFDKENVENKLLERCLGITIKEKKVRKDPDGNILDITETEKEIPPDVSSLTLYLRNRMPEVYCEKRRLEIETTDSNSLSINSYSLRDIVELSKNVSK